MLDRIRSAMTRRLATFLGAAALAALLPAAPASADLNPERITMWPTSGTRICDAYANYIAVDAYAKTAGAGRYKFRYTLMRNGANFLYSPMQGPWSLAGWTNYAMSAWSGYADIPSGAGLRAWLFKYVNGTWQTSAYKTVACFTPIP